MCNFLCLIYLLRHLSRTYRRQTDRFTMSYFEKLVTWIFEICQSKYKDSLLTNHCLQSVKCKVPLL